MSRPLTEPALPHGVLARLTGAKAVANTGLRWIPPFLPTLEAAFGASTTQLTTILGVGEMAGLSTIAVGPALDRGRERLAMTAALVAVSVSSFVALGGSTASFAVAFLILVLGVANYTVAAQTYISHRVAYRRRARSMGILEISWALSLLIGAPIIAVLIDTFGWRGPFVAVGIVSAVAAVMIALTIPDRAAGGVVTHGETPAQSRVPITRRAWLVIGGSACTAMAGVSIFVISGSWLDDQFGLSTSRLGLVAMGFGAVELLSTGSSAGFADRLGKLRCTVGGIALLSVGLCLISLAGDRLAVGVAGLLVFLLGFEFGFVTSLSLVSEAMPEARGTTLAISNGVGTIARGAGTIASGMLYSTFGISGTVWLSAIAAALALAAFLVSRRQLR